MHARHATLLCHLQWIRISSPGLGAASEIIVISGEVEAVVLHQLAGLNGAVLYFFMHARMSPG